MLTYTFVSSGIEARVLLRAVFISSADPSKNLPQPKTLNINYHFKNGFRCVSGLPPWNRVSPVKTTLPVESSINQHMLSCVWQGVYNALTAISPILKPSPFFGVFVTSSQSLPPIIGFPWMAFSCGEKSLAVVIGKIRRSIPYL